MPYHSAALALCVGYSLLATDYARRTPAWQIPDEPAHFNYIEQVARSPLSPPVIEPGDYPFNRLEALKANRSGPPPDITGIEYEDHQPPLYYYAASVAYRLSPDAAGRLPAVRLLGVFLGAITLAAAWRIALVVVPHEPALAVGTMAFVAFLPMNLTVTGAANNDALATPLGALLLLATLKRALLRISSGRFVATAGVLLGLAYLTKVTLYPLTAVVIAGGILGERRARRADSPRRLPWAAVAPVLLGGLIALPWFIRDMIVYGANDPLGLQTHNAVVVGQERTATWILEHGLAETAQRLLVFTFESFWGVFGWMGVFLAPWAYGLLAIVTAAALTGLAAAVVRLRREGRGPDAAVVLPLGLTVVMVVGGFLFYNLTFVQHQGRYLFPALVPIALALCVGTFELGAGAARMARRPGLARCAGGAALYAGVAMLALLAYLSLERYVVPPAS